MEVEYGQGDFFQLAGCRELLEAHPESLRIQHQVEALESAMPDRPGDAVSFCRAIIETTCKTILTDRNVAFDSKWKAPKLASETMKCLKIDSDEEEGSDTKLQNALRSLPLPRPQSWYSKAKLAASFRWSPWPHTNKI